MQLRTLTCLGFVLAVICVLEMAPVAESCLPILINPVKELVKLNCKIPAFFNPLAAQCALAPSFFELLETVCSVCFSIPSIDDSQSSTPASTTAPAA